MRDLTDMENRRINIRGLFTAMEVSVRNVATLVQGEVKVTMRYLC